MGYKERGRVPRDHIGEGALTLSWGLQKAFWRRCHQK